MNVISPEQLHHLWQQHTAALLLLARGYCRGIDVSPEDCVQEAFVRLATQCPVPDCPRAWLLRVVRNLAIDAKRCGSQRLRSVLPMELLPATEA
ncbi:MAG: hypothetical protein KDA96_26225, partial [Planctomycetaceae bacterium]|nr:hypothetical protein [Planctomycetaceae bacterium]